MTRRAYITYYTLLFEFLLAGLFIGTVTDLDIASAVYQPSNTFARFIDIWGQAPAFLILAESLLIFGFGVRFPKRYSEVICMTACSVLALICLLYFFKDAVRVYTTKGNMLYMLLSVVFWLIIMLTTSFFKRDTLKRLVKPAAVAVLYITLILVFTLIFKVLIDRPRYTDLLESGSLDGFKLWYNVHPGGEGESFPSGHVAAYTCLLAGMFYTRANRSIHKYRLPMFLFVNLSACLVGFARMCYGAHYLADVIFSLIMCNLAFVLIDFVLLPSSDTFVTIKK